MGREPPGCRHNRHSQLTARSVTYDLFLGGPRRGGNIVPYIAFCLQQEKLIVCAL